jgi:hypothetical protein
MVLLAYYKPTRQWRPINTTFTAPLIRSLTMGLLVACLCSSGRYIENHGVIHNIWFNTTTQEKKQYYMTQFVDSYWDNGSLPIWITAQRQVGATHTNTQIISVIPFLIPSTSLGGSEATV